MAKSRVEDGSAESPAGDARVEPTVIKKYANRRLYDTERSTYVTLADLAEMTRAGKEFVVRDARTDEDITAAIFVQIVLESESSGDHMLPIGFLRRLVALYGDTMRWVVPSYLESSMEIFTRNQELLRQQMGSTLANPAAAGLEQFKEVNRALFEPAMKMMVPFPGGEEGGVIKQQEAQSDADYSASRSQNDQIQELRTQVDELKTLVAKLATKS